MLGQPWELITYPYFVHVDGLGRDFENEPGSA